MKHNKPIAITPQVVRETEKELGLREIIDAGLEVFKKNNMAAVIAKAIEKETDISWLRSCGIGNARNKEDCRK